MTSQTGDCCQSNESNNSFPNESLRFPLDSSMRIVFTGYYTGFCVELRSPDEGALLYHMGCFGKGSASRSKPKLALDSGNPSILRKRQFAKRNYWAKKFYTPADATDDTFFKTAKELSSKIIRDSGKRVRKDVIDLVSSEEPSDDNNDTVPMDIIQPCETAHSVVIVPNSDSEGEDYFDNMKPKCCINKIKIEEKLILSLQEAFFLLYGLGCLQIVNSDNKLMNIRQCWDRFVQTDKNFIPKYVVYHYFRAKGYVVKPGIKFGGDYLLYKDGPEATHATHIVVIRTDSINDSWVTVLGHVRMAVTTAKEVLIAEVIKPETVQELPEALSQYSVREIILSRKIPVSINDDQE